MLKDIEVLFGMFPPKKQLIVLKMFELVMDQQATAIEKATKDRL